MAVPQLRRDILMSNSCFCWFKKKSTPLIDETELTIHKLYRERIVQEDTLINHRMTWMIVSQSLLLALWAAVYKSDSHPNQFVHVIEVIGILFASGSGFSIAAAQGEIEKLKRNYMDFYPTEEWTKQNRRPNHKRKKPIPRVSVRDDILPELTGTKHFHRMGHIVPTAMPWLLALLWAILGAFSAGLLKT